MKMQSLYDLSSKDNNNNQAKLFRGVLINWKELTQSEKIVSLGIIVIPLWWVIGWAYMPLLWVAGVVIWEIKCYRQIRLEKPSIPVIALLLFSCHRAISYIFNSPEIAPRLLVDPFLFWGCGALLLWYIQSHKIRVRLEIIAWAFSVLICMMLLWWLFCHFVIREPNFVPLPNLSAIFLDKGSYRFNKLGNVGNFLFPYYFGEPGIGGLIRYTFFFTHPTVTSFVIGFAGLIVLDIKNTYWCFPIVSICSFLIIICQARNSWLALPIVLILRWLIINGKTKGLSFILMLLAVISFLSFSCPFVTNAIVDYSTGTVENTSNFRKDSTEVRNLIYQRTWAKFVEEPSFLGYGINGASVLPGYDYAGIGTESFVLGTLLYKSGIIGSGLFVIFFIAFIYWLLESKNRPLSSFLILIYLGLCSLVTEFTAVEMFILLIAGMIKNRKIVS